MEPYRRHLTTPNKLGYIRGERPDVPCIFCAVRDKNPQVDALEVYRTPFFMVSLNLYPYNPGHLMLVPLRHVESPTELTEEEVLALHHLQKKALAILEKKYRPAGFNIGYNLGPAGGGSIDHLHLHLVPRFFNEQGFMGTIAHTQLMVEDPNQVLADFKALFAEAESLS